MCSAIQDILRSWKIVFYHVVWLDPPIHKYSQDFSSSLFADTYTSLNVTWTSSFPRFFNLPVLYFFTSCSPPARKAK